MAPPIRITETIKPAKITQPKPGVFVVDLGQNIAGAARLTVQGPAGTDIKLQYAELLNPDGTIDNRNIKEHCHSGEFQTDHYILKGIGIETWQPRFMKNQMRSFATFDFDRWIRAKHAIKHHSE